MLQTLPAELRTLIYHYIFADLRLRIKKRRSRALAVGNLSILFVSRFFYQDNVAKVIFQEHARLVVRTTNDWLALVRYHFSTRRVAQSFHPSLQVRHLIWELPVQFGLPSSAFWKEVTHQRVVEILAKLSTYTILAGIQEGFIFTINHGEPQNDPPWPTSKDGDYTGAMIAQRVFKGDGYSQDSQVDRLWSALQEVADRPSGGRPDSMTMHFPRLYDYQPHQTTTKGYRKMLVLASNESHLSHTVWNNHYRYSHPVADAVIDLKDLTVRSAQPVRT